MSKGLVHDDTSFQNGSDLPVPLPLNHKKTMQKLIIHNFRQIKEASVDIRQLMFLIGEQGSGKSTIAKLIYFFKSLRQDYIDLITHSTISNNQQILESFLKAIQDKFAIYFGYTSHYSNDFEIKFYFSVDNDDFIKLFKNKRLCVEFSENLWHSLCQTTKYLIKSNGQQESETSSNFFVKEKMKNVYLDAVRAKASDVFSDQKETLFIPAGRNITVSFPEQFQLLFFGAIGASALKGVETNTIDINLMRDFCSYSKFLVDYFSDDRHNINPSSPFLLSFSEKIATILQGKYNNRGGNERLYFSKEGFVPLNIASSGQQESIRIIQDLIYILIQKEKTTRIVEEPEAHLFPSAQILLVELMIMVANYTGTQFILTTHSPFIMTAFNNLLYYNKVIETNPQVKEDVKNYFHTIGFDERKNESLGISPDIFNAYALKIGDGVYCNSIFDAETHLIGDNYFDEVSEEAYGKFDYLFSKI